MDAGKSSLVGVLTHGMDGRPLLDNGSGSARMNVFQHKHEIETGRTSSLSQQMLGYDEAGRATPSPCNDICNHADVVFEFVCGAKMPPCQLTCHTKLRYEEKIQSHAVLSSFLATLGLAMTMRVYCFVPLSPFLSTHILLVHSVACSLFEA